MKKLTNLESELIKIICYHYPYCKDDINRLFKLVNYSIDKLIITLEIMMKHKTTYND